MASVPTSTSAIPANGLARSQWNRRQRMLDAAAELALAGGFAGVQMREVARIADVALGTLYRYFPSKEHLLVALLVRQLEEMRVRFQRRPPKGDDPHQRVVSYLMRATRIMEEEPEVTMAMTRALMAADATMTDEVADAQRVMADMIVEAMHPDVPDPAPEEHDIARVIQRVWLGAFVAWTGGRATVAQVREDLRLAADLLLLPRDSVAAERPEARR